MEYRDYTNCCDDCLRDLTGGVHCGNNGCHEQFATRALYLTHIHERTRGCKFPGNIKYFFERRGTWYKNHLAELRDQAKRTADPYPNSKPTRSAVRRTTSNVSGATTSQVDQQPGRSLA